tara:strand:- start:3961 stop:4113 length:153 start_codon:yes stop_codon:yes gene_type:complete
MSKAGQSIDMGNQGVISNHPMMGCMQGLHCKEQSVFIGDSRRHAVAMALK